MKWLLLFVVCLGPNLVAWLLLLGMRVFFGGQRFLWSHEMVTLELARDSWFRKRFYRPFDPVTGRPGWGGTTFGPHACFVNWGETHTGVLKHESIHGEQLEVEAIQNAVLGIAAYVAGAPWWICAGWYVLGGLVAFISGFVVAWMRGEPFYRGSTFEEAAYNAGAACVRDRASA